MIKLRRHGVLGLVCGAAAALMFVAFALLVGTIALRGAGSLSLDFFTAAPSRFASQAGIAPALVGTLWLALVVAVTALPLGVGSAIYLEEYAAQGRFARHLGGALANLAGMPSVVYGLIGLAIFAHGMGLGRSILAGGFTLAAFALPTVTVTAREAIRAVPSGVRSAAYAAGATRWQVVRLQVFPAALPGIVTGAAHTFTRILGEAAPLLVIGAASFVAFSPQGVNDPLTSLPTRVYAWTARSQDEFTALAAGAILALFVVLVAVHGTAALIRHTMKRAHLPPADPTP